MTDYQELLQLNLLLQSIFQSSYDGIYVADAQANGIMVNEAYTRITGVTAEELIGKNLRDIVKEGIINESVTFKVLEKKRPITIVQKVREKEVLVTGNPIYDEHGEITYVVTNVRDISELNRLKLELQQSKALTRKYLNEIQDFKLKESMQLLMDGVVAHSKEIINVLHLVQKVAKVDSSVLILGESGVGKEVIVKMIHKASDRGNFPLIKVNCAAIPHPLLESELFGYEKGAFTGADSRGKPGLFERGNGGTIFLDEIGDMPLDLQVKLLRVLQEFEITRVGGRESIKVDVRVISATHKQLDKLVEKGEFRHDLYYRLNIVPIKIPPLRERKADIAPLAYFFLNKTNERYGFNKKFHPEVISFMEHYEWPGNIREMENLIERLVVTVDQDEIQIHDLPLSLTSQGPQMTESSLKELIEEVERKTIEQKLAEHRTTRKTARVLGISQSALVKKMQRLGIK
ncbi:sigma-54 interaction domain-containing protein [Effusibacillus consociatus]|uniref:Sigma-54 interaction domain-containing protein n=1 Tax=Effusibacillus consociatus TaxID=1117041 RepID=A0ABV9Q1M3_9BACL